MHQIVATIFGGWEVVLILAIFLIVLGRKRVPELTRGLGQGFSEFRKASDEMREEMDNLAGDAGKSLGGIYGKRAAQALTPDNQTAELYDPAVFQKLDKSDGHRWRLWRVLLYSLASKLSNVSSGLWAGIKESIAAKLRPNPRRSSGGETLTGSTAKGPGKQQDT